MKRSNIGIALSGGGIRATIYHLGLFQWLAENQLMEEVRRVSSVSGASLCVGLLFSHNQLKWPTSGEYLNKVLPSIEKALLAHDLQKSALLKLVVSPSYWNRKVNIVADALERKWGVYGKLSQLPDSPMWYSNCTTFETGKRFRFTKKNMGDYKTGYVTNPDIPLSQIMAASAGFPILIGPYKLKTGDYQWSPSGYSAGGWQPPSQKYLHLWDGGVYDNLGMESIFTIKNGGTLKEGLDFMIVSNASASIQFKQRTMDLSAGNLKRMLDIAMDQVGSLRSRTIMDFIQNTGNGMYVKIGDSAERITAASGCSEDVKQRLLLKCLSQQDALRAMNYPTTLAKPTEDGFRLLLRHGYETALCVYSCYQDNPR